MTEDGAKEWVTIKIPASIRDDARNDPHTYGDIMDAGMVALDAGLVTINNDIGAVTTKADAEGGVGNLDPFGGEVPDVSQPGVPTAEEIATELEDTLEREGVNVDLIAEQVVDLMAAESVGVGYDDVVAASRQALREELPQGALQR